MTFDLFNEDLLKLVLSAVAGMIIGIERELRGKAVNVHTIALVALGATLFTMVSVKIGGGSPDRIAANIVTGVGFLGAGVIFKEGFNVVGLTTATAIWIAAGIGMSIGVGAYEIAGAGLIVITMVLLLFEKIPDIVDRFREHQTYRIHHEIGAAVQESFEARLQSLNLKFQFVRTAKLDGKALLVYDVYGKKANIVALNQQLQEDAEVVGFEYS